VRATLGVAPGWAVVGDADYHRDPITGHGMTDAFRDAELLAVAIGSALRSPRDESAALAGYARARNAAVRETFELTRDQPFPPLPRLIELQIQGDIDLRGILGLDPGVRNGFQGRPGDLPRPRAQPTPRNSPRWFTSCRAGPRSTTSSPTASGSPST
jgi:hypothetical protein